MPPASLYWRSPSFPALHFQDDQTHLPVMLLLHGVTRHGGDWTLLLPELRRHWRVVLLDHLGHGKSDRSAAGYHVVDYAKLTAAFVRDTFHEPIVVVGHSLGAMVALSLAADCADQVSHVVLEDPPFHTMGENISMTPYRDLFIGMQAVARANGGVDRRAQMLAEVTVSTATGPARLGDLRDEQSLRFSAECLSHLDPEVLTCVIAGKWLDGFDYESLWLRVECPALLLQADPTSGGTFTDADLTTALPLMQNLKHVRFEGTGHQIHGTHPKRFVQEVLDFSRSHN
ncbi:MAG: alpha/beta hydrolase [Planctomycetaceae bacterium]|nr:alpha/beta hydrolase [Planctomycetaceae bacterium]MCB9949560.1 alpha/beta hydrolase [Planctomycetaceae bacterium]